MHSKVNRESFKGQTIYVGIDVHLKSWKVSIYSQHCEHKTFSQAPNPELLVKYLERNFPGASYQAVYEAGFSGFGSCRFLQSSGVDCMVIHPADVPTTRKEQLQKTDKVDSRKLARALRAGQVQAIDLPDEILEADRSLVRQRHTIVKEVARVKNRIKSLLFYYGIEIPFRFTSAQTRHWSKPYIEWLREIEISQKSLRITLDNYLTIGLFLRQQLLQLNKQLRELSEETRYKSKHELLISVPGIGLKTSMTLLTQIGDIKRFKRLDELCSYIGLIPSMRGSGEKMKTGKLVSRGRKELKIMLIEASWIAIRHDPTLMLKFNELAQRMNKNKAIIRIARKLLSRIRHLLINQQVYEKGLPT